jgi:hypothetical protein
MHMSYVHPLQHVEGMLLAYLAQEKMISLPIWASATGYPCIDAVADFR